MKAVAHVYHLPDVTFLIRNTALDFIIVPMRKYYPPCNDLLWWCFGTQTKAKHEWKF